jgi:multidomain signaling protein FimX
MAKQDAVIRLLLVEDQLEDAEQLISMLRNGGMAIRPQRPESAENLSSLLASQSIDIVLANIDATYIGFKHVADTVAATGKDIAVLASSSVLDEKSILGAIEQGARDVALRSNQNHVQFVVRNEFNALQSRRGMRHIEAALRESERRCDTLISSSRDPIAYVHEGMHIRANEAYLEIFGFDEFEDIEGLSVIDLVAPSDSEKFKQLLKNISKGEPPPKKLECGAIRSDGSKFDAVMEFSSASYEGESCLQIVFRQQTIDAEMVKELDTLRQRDVLTGLYNRQYFMSEIEPMVAAAASGKANQAILIIQPDNYDTKMDEVGMALVDEALKQLTQRITATVGDDTVVARLADYTIGILCKQHDYKQTNALAEKIRAAFDGQLLDVAEKSLVMNLSVGGVQIGEKIASVPQILAKANQCLQSAEAIGGNRVEIFDPAARDRAEEERIQAWVNRIKEALAEDQFVLNYQPMISISGAEGETYEVLLRMKSPSGEIVSPEQFIDIAEENGLLSDIDRWVVSRTIKLLTERKEKGLDTTLYVKVMPSTLVENDFHTFVAAQLKAHGISGDKLVLQIPESKIFSHLKALQAFQKIAASFGCRLCLEQFGTGLNSFQILTHFSPAVLKIDRSFIIDVAKNPESQAKVKEIVAQAQKLEKQCVAEFVSDAGGMSFLFSSGVDFVQGNFLATPMADMTYEF